MSLQKILNTLIKLWAFRSAIQPAGKYYLSYLKSDPSTAVFLEPCLLEIAFIG